MSHPMPNNDVMHATPGPWEWEVTPSGDVHLVTPDRGKLYVMGFERKGMQGAAPRFSVWKGADRARQGGIMHSFDACGGGNHPDARLISEAPAMHLALALICAGVARIDSDTDEFWFDGFWHAVRPSETWTDRINKIGWQRCREALVARGGE